MSQAELSGADAVAFDNAPSVVAPQGDLGSDLARLAQWQARNDDFLAVALRWLRLCLKRHIQQLSTEQLNADDGAGRIHDLPANTEGLEGLEGLAVINKEIAHAAERMAQLGQHAPLPALPLLAQQFGLSQFEQETLLLCTAMELDTRMAAFCAQAQQDPNRPYPTFALAMMLFANPAWEVLSPERPLRFWRLLEIHQPGVQPLTTSALRVDERILNFLKGLNYLDDRLRPLLMPFMQPVRHSELPPSQEEAVTSILQQLGRSQQTGDIPIIQLTGIDSAGKQLIAQRVARELAIHLERLPIGLLPAEMADLETFARLWQRESILMPVALYVDAHELEINGRQEGEQRNDTSTLQRFLIRSQGIFFVSRREAGADLGTDVFTVAVDKPSPQEQRSAWSQALAGRAGNFPMQLAGQFNLNISTIEQIVQRSTEESGTNGHIPQRLLWDACLVHTAPRLDLLAQRLHPKATWDDIVLPPETETTLRQIAGQVHHRMMVYDNWGFRDKRSRGLGINALFAGDSGTGKTMAAEVLANDLRLNLYRIDLSGVVSKYIGETEKNLRRLFDAAEDGGGILFFDEADALFGKRSEVKDSHDRYANIEVNYLLQRMESYSGLAILATNMKSALDEAFMRRLRFIINFAFPGQRERKVIWQRVFPPQTPLDDLDYERLARFNLTGGAINNIALNAAFMAAQNAESVSMPILLEATRTEYRKLDRPIKEADFQWE